MTLDMGTVKQVPSPNYTAEEIAHDVVFLHDMEGYYAPSVAYLCQPSVRASAHLAMNEDGSEWTQMVPLQFKAWAGREVAPALSPIFDPFEYAHYQEVVDFAAKNKLIRHKFDVNAFLEPRFATQALKDLNLTDYWTPVDAAGKPLKPGL